MVLDDNVTSTVTLNGARNRGFSSASKEEPRRSKWIASTVSRAGNPTSSSRPAGNARSRAPTTARRGRNWGGASGAERPGRNFNPSVAFAAPSRSRFLPHAVRRPERYHLAGGGGGLFDNHERVRVGGPYNFTSAWMSAGAGERVGLRGPGRGLHVRSRGALLDSAGRREARSRFPTTPRNGRTSVSRCPPAGVDRRYQAGATGATGPLRARLHDQARGARGYILSEMEVYGRGGRWPGRSRRRRRERMAGWTWPAAPGAAARFAGAADGAAISKPGFADKGWVVGHRAGNRADQLSQRRGGSQSRISATTNCRFRIPSSTPISGIATSSSRRPRPKGSASWLNFDGINWKADVFLNGAKMGRIEGGFMRGRFDVTELIHPGQRTRWRCASRRPPRRQRQGKGQRAPDRMAARWAPTIPLITLRPDGIGCPPSAAATAGSGATST